MTLETLIRIVIEAVEKILAMEKLQILALGFDKQNAETLTSTMRSINANGRLLFHEDGELPDTLPDVLFVDYIPVRYLADIALGICASPFTTFFSGMLLAGKTITVLGYDPAVLSSAPAGCVALLNTYYRLIKAYGVRFAHGPAAAAQPSTHTRTVHTGNVLSKADLAGCANDGEIIVRDGVVVTDLAREEARIRNIKILKD